MKRVRRPTALILGLVWLLGFFGLIDLAGIFDFGSDDVDLVHLSISWGSLVTYFVVIPLFALAFRQASTTETVGVLLVAIASLSLGALLSGIAARDAGPLLLALPLALTVAVIGVLDAPPSRRRTAFPRSPLVPRWRLVALAVVGFSLWLPYVVHGVSAQGELPDDITIGLNHWPVQVSAGIAVMLASVVAAVVPGHRSFPIVAASLTSVSIGASMAANLDAATATEGGPWGIACVLWGTALALSRERPNELPSRGELSRPDYLAQLPRKVVAAGALITDLEGCILIVKPTYKDGWEVPGGCVETGESGREACSRELAEELGLAITIGRLLVVEHQTLPEDKGDSLMLVYDGGVIDGGAGFVLAADELEEARFVEDAHLGEFLPIRQARRMSAAVQARETGVVFEMVDGQVVQVRIARSGDNLGS